MECLLFTPRLVGLHLAAQELFADKEVHLKKKKGIKKPIGLLHRKTRTQRAGQRARRLKTTATRILIRLLLITATSIPEKTARHVLRMTNATTYLVTM